MPSGIYQRTKKKTKTKRARATVKAATKKKRGPGRPKKKLGSQKKAGAAPRVRKSQGRSRSGKVYADFGAVIEAIHEFGRLLDARSKLLIDGLNTIADAIAGDEPATVGVVDDQATQVNGTPAEETSGASAPVS